MKRLSTLLFTLSLGYAAHAQIPNASFENWTARTAPTGNYDTPDDWGNLDTLGTITLLNVGYTCEKGSPGAAGSGYIKLTSKTSTIGVIPGAAVSGKINVSGLGSFNFSSGFAISSRPENLTGSWRYAPAGADQGHIMVLLTQWNTALNKKDTISFTDHALSGSVNSWATFSIPLTYQHGTNPDTGMVILLSGAITGGQNGSMLSVDDLAFTGNVPNGVVNVNNTASSIDIYPNPAAAYASIAYRSATSGSVHISVVNISGKSVTEMDFKKMRGANDFPINVSKMAAGMYFVKITDENGVTVKKLFVE